MTNEVVVAEGDADDKSPPGGRLGRLPNGMEVAYQHRAELEHFYQDIFEHEAYLRHGQALPEEACVFDVGGNIGLFTLFVQKVRPRSRVFTFEPAPPLFEILSWNVRRHAPGAQLLNCGAADAPGSARFTFYPQSSGMSSFHARQDEERALLEVLMKNEAEHGAPGAREMLRHAEDYLEERLKHETFECQLTTLSRVIRDHDVRRIDLLKIDVQKSEFQVLEGLEADDWPKVRQIVVEVHDTDGRVERMRQYLVERGFSCIVEQDELYQGSEIFLLYAGRKATAKITTTEMPRDGLKMTDGALANIKARGQRQRMKRFRKAGRKDK